MNEENNTKSTPSLDNLEAYKIALDTRNMEIGLFWQRSNYFLVLNAALAVGFFRLIDNKYSILLAFFGLLVSFLWYRVNLGSKYWQSRWEHRLKLKEEEIDPNLNFFSAEWSLIKDDVTKSLGYSKHNQHNIKGKFHIWLDEQVLKKPSVSYNMTLLSFLFLLGWALLIIIRLFFNAAT